MTTRGITRSTQKHTKSIVKNEISIQPTMKKTLTLLILFNFSGLLIYSQPSGKSLPQLGKDPVSKVIAAMSPEEKVSLVVGGGMRMSGMGYETYL